MLASFNFLTTAVSPGYDFLFMEALVEHSQSKDKFLRIVVKRLTETQLFKDELKEVSQLNTILLALNQDVTPQVSL
jgi:hypothetical protein